MRSSCLLVVLLPLVASAGDIGTREYEATVKARAVVKTATFPDLLALDDASAVPVIEVGRSCALTLQLKEPYFRKPMTVYASVGACERVRAGITVRVQTLGLADKVQVIALELDQTWHALPLMRTTRSTHVVVQACLAATDPHCTPRAGPAL